MGNYIITCHLTLIGEALFLTCNKFKHKPLLLHMVIYAPNACTASEFRRPDQKVHVTYKKATYQNRLAAKEVPM